MKTVSNLRNILQRIDGRGYKAYKDIRDRYRLDDGMTLIIDHVQGDPFASPSHMRIRISQETARIPRHLFNNHIRRIALEDYLGRKFKQMLGKTAQGHRGSGKSGLINIDTGGQEVLSRTAIRITDDAVEARFVIGLPARGRTVLGRQAEEMLVNELPAVASASLIYRGNDNKIEQFVNLTEDQEHLRSQLGRKGLVAFVANGAILPRRSGIHDTPLTGKDVVPFQSPKQLETTLSTLHHGNITGMGIPTGVTLIVGGGYHGKSTVLKALERGVYNHIPGDGREFVVSDPSAAKIRAEDGRSIVKVDISNFISNLPGKQDTSQFTSADASGSTSQAANIIEAIEARSTLLLLDEDTSATNFMIRDKRMQELVHRNKEPITPFIDRVKQLYTELNISTILVIGGSGDYFDIADTVIMLDNYQPAYVTEQARAIANNYPSLRKHEVDENLAPIARRIVLKKGFSAKYGNRTKIKVRGKTSIQYSEENIDLSFVEQLVDTSQTRAIACMLQYALENFINEQRTIPEIVNLLFEEVRNHGLEVLSPFNYPTGDLALPRPTELAAAINRLRSLHIS